MAQRAGDKDRVKTIHAKIAKYKRDDAGVWFRRLVAQRGGPGQVSGELVESVS